MLDRLAGRLLAAGCVFAEQEASILLAEAADEAQLEHLMQRRIAGEPLEHVVGWAQFAGMRIAVDPGVFIPRVRSELLARCAVAALPARPSGVVVDLCCGTGAIAAAVARARPDAQIHACDIDPRAVSCARRNLPSAAEVHLGDLWSALPDELQGRVAVATANAPYVPSGSLPTLPTQFRDHEPALTHDGGPDGLAVLRRILDPANRWLAPAGLLLVEVAETQVAAARTAFEEHGLRVQVVSQEDLGAYVLIGCAR